MPKPACLTVYSRRGCHLCEVLLGELEALLRGQAAIQVLDIDQSPALRDLYGTRIPVVASGSDVLCEFKLDRTSVLTWLDAQTIERD